MDPYREQRLREEAMYLHSLWHQGPSSNPSAKPNYRNPNPNQRSAHHSNPNRRNAHQSNRSQLKPVDKKIKKRLKRDGKKLPPPPGIERPSNEVTQVQSSSSGGTISNPVQTKSVDLPNVQEQALLDGTRVQDEVIEVSKKFFAENENSGGGIDSDGDNDIYDTMVNFFENLFKENDELRDYYEKNKKNGEFSCLVCVVIWKKIRKRFKNCFSLLQHSVTVPKTKKKHAHRAYAQVICNVLGWDINRVPAMHTPSNKQTDKSKGNAEVAIDRVTNNKKDSELDNVDMKGSNVNQDEELPSSNVPETSGVDNMMHCESSLKADNVDKCIENNENGVSNTAGNSSG